ncbi:hypothetical protein CALCODRAFT_481903 [Calocera cornea HHB12733]|uniref:Uncharacterized protein n=1 Tax=Calocera cornea HHB12733 TaxID=1353952 RepID=A0A165H877_9BASI|nr:hypothetical protein CALCODRAFT_481903 [Calocera cornea HHB12733]
MAYYGPSLPYAIPQLLPPPVAYATVALVPVWQYSSVLPAGPGLPANPYSYQYGPAPPMTVVPAYPPNGWNAPPPTFDATSPTNSGCGSLCTAFVECLTAVVQLVAGGGC